MCGLGGIYDRCPISSDKFCRYYKCIEKCIAQNEQSKLRVGISVLFARASLSQLQERCEDFLMETTFDSDKRKLLSAVSHGSIFFSQLIFSAGVPLALLVLSDDPVVKDNSREALNFHFNMWLYSVLLIIPAALIIGLPLVALLGLVQVIMPIFAILSSVTAPDMAYRYPFIFRPL